MVTVAIVYHSGFGHTKLQAEAVHRGAASVAGVEARLLTTDEAASRLVRGPSAMPGNWRRAKKARKPSTNPLRHPLPPTRELAEWVEFLEKNADFGLLRSSFGGGGPQVRSATRRTWKPGIASPFNRRPHFMRNGSWLRPEQPLPRFLSN